MAQLQKKTLLGPSAPFRGMNTSSLGAFLPPGKMSSAVNVRSVEGLPVIRLPLTNHGSVVVAAASFRGFYGCVMDQAPYLFVALFVSSAVRVYKSINTGTTWTEVTTTSGPYGSTRLTDTGGLVEFQVVHDRPPFGGVAQDCLIIQNGTDLPRIYAKGATNGTFGTSTYGMTISAQPLLPTGVLVSAGLTHYHQVNNAAKHTIGTPPTGMVVTDGSATVGESYLIFEIQSTYVAGTPVTITLDNSSLINAGLTNSITYVTSTPSTTTPVDQDFWKEMLIEVSANNTDWATVYDPRTPTADFGELTPPPRFLAAIWLQFGSLVTPGTVNMTALKYIRFTWYGASPGAGSLFGQLYVFGAQGFVAAGASYAAAYVQVDGRGIGPAQIASTFPTLIANNGGSRNYPVTMSSSPAFLYDYSLKADNATNTTSGVDRLYVYRRSIGETDFFLLGSALMAHWNGSAWITDNLLGTFFVDASGAQEDLSRNALDTAFVVVPPGLAMAASTQRLFVSALSRVWFSGAERPFEFRQFVLTDDAGNLEPDSPGSFTIDGETIMALLDIGSLSGGNETLGVPSNGISTLFVLTDRTLSWVTGWDATSLNKRNLLYSRGTYAPKALAPSRTGFCYFDTDNQVVKVDGYQVEQISRDVVDLQLGAVPTSRIPWMWGVCRNDRYYLSFSPAGASTNLQCLIYDVHESARIGEHIWFQDTFPVSVSGVSAILAFRDGSQTRLMGMDAVGQCVEHETYGGTADQGASGVAWSLTFPELHNGLFDPLTVRRMGVVADVQMGTITTTRTSLGRNNTSPSSATIKTNAADGITGVRAVRWDQSSDGGNAGITSSSAQCSVSGLSPSGKHLIAVQVEFEIPSSNNESPDVNP